MPKPSPAKKKPGRRPKLSSHKLTRSKRNKPIPSRSRSSFSPKFNKNAAVKQSSPATPKRAQATKSTAMSQKSPAGSLRSRLSLMRSASVKQYEAAMKLLYSHEYERAKAVFERIVNSFADDKDVLERARIHLKLCEQKMARKPPAPKTLDEHYNLGIALMNEGRYDEAFDHLNRALRSDPKCEYVIYALAAIDSRKGNLETALSYLQTAITLKPENRFLAQRDADFEALKHDTRFISLVFPERLSTPA
jgi:tetratricopeptide (TPR) repeat protein